MTAKPLDAVCVIFPAAMLVTGFCTSHMAQRPQTYLVSYTTQGGGGTSVGDTYVVFPRGLHATNDLEAVRRQLKQAHRADSVVITFIHEVK